MGYFHLQQLNKPNALYPVISCPIFFVIFLFLSLVSCPLSSPVPFLPVPSLVHKNSILFRSCSSQTFPQLSCPVCSLFLSFSPVRSDIIVPPYTSTYFTVFLSVLAFFILLFNGMSSLALLVSSLFLLITDFVCLNCPAL